jgi:acyl-CoA thioesterase-2
MITPPLRPSMVELLDLEELDTELFRGLNEYPDAGRETLYGGQVAAQALMAAGRTVPAGRLPHSAHCYFLRRGRRDRPVIFRVERDRDGRSFSARRVSAAQGGAVIMDLTASFCDEAEGGEYAVAMPNDLTGPDDCTPEGFRNSFPNADARVIPPTVDDGTGRAVSGRLWVRVRDPLPDDRLVNACALAYLSDIGTAFHSPDVRGLPRGGASLDHAIWFRAPIRADDWILSDMSPLHAGGGRGVYVGSMFQHDGTLGVSFAQESILTAVPR